MIHDFDPSEKSKNALLRALKELKISQLLKKVGIRKAQGASTYEVLKFLVLLVFQQKNLYRFLDSDRKDTALSKNTYYRFLNRSTYAWRKFLFVLAIRVIEAFKPLTRAERVNVLVLDDTYIGRERSKKVELLARVHDHTDNRYKKGFTMIVMGWSDGYSFIPVDFAMLSSAKQSNRIQEAGNDIDKRSHGYKRRAESMEKKPDVAFGMIQSAINQGTPADYVLMDSWFTHEPFIMKIKAEGLDVIGMVKDVKQKYNYKGKLYSLKALRRTLPQGGSASIFGSALVTTKNGLPIKLVFVRNRNNKKEWLAVLSTDLSLLGHEVIRIYGNRWSIEVFFKSAKSFMKLGREFEGRSYDLMISHTTIVCTRYILLTWINRNEHDLKTFGELFFQFCDDIRDMDLHTALQSLMGLFLDHLNHSATSATSIVMSQLHQWFSLQPSYIKALFLNISWES